ncbi:MAG: ribokinase [Halobacteriales archaeon]
MVEVLSAGHVNWDVTLRVSQLPAPDGEASIHSQRGAGGGSAGNVAAALASLGVSSGIVGSVGDDEYGMLARRELEREGVDSAGLREVDGDTSTKYLLVDDEGEVAVLGNDGVNEAVGPEDVDPKRVEKANHLHLTSQRPETAARLASVAAQAELTISVDPGRRLPERDFSESLDLADVIFLNDREAEAALEADYQASDFADRVLVIKRGEEGAEVHTPDGTLRHPGFDVPVTDTTGAGDAFAAGFVAVLREGGDYERALEFANACGALAARTEGAKTAPSRNEIERFLAGQF